MKIYIPKSSGWYMAVLFIFSPVVLLYVISPDWFARVIGVLLQAVFGLLILLWIIFGKKITLIKDDSPLISRFGKNKVVLFIKCIIIIFTLFAFKTTCLPIFKDVLVLVNTKTPIEKTATVTSTQQGLGLIFETVTLDSSVGTKENMFQAYYFSPRHIMQGNTYKFLYLPNSRFIIEANLVNGN